MPSLCPHSRAPIIVRTFCPQSKKSHFPHNFVVNAMELKLVPEEHKDRRDPSHPDTLEHCNAWVFFLGRAVFLEHQPVQKHPRVAVLTLQTQCWPPSPGWHSPLLPCQPLSITMGENREMQLSWCGTGRKTRQGAGGNEAVMHKGNGNWGISEDLASKKPQW